MKWHHQFFHGFVWRFLPRLPAGSCIKRPGCLVWTSWTPVSADNRCNATPSTLSVGLCPQSAGRRFTQGFLFCTQNNLHAFISWPLPDTTMPFPPISLHQRISSPGRELFGKKKANGVPPEQTSKSCGERGGSDKEKQPTSWASANLRNLGRKPQQDKNKSPTQKPGAGQETQGKSSWLMVPKPQDSSEGVRRSSSMDSTRQLSGKEEGKKEIQFTLSLTPEAILVIQKRNLEKQMMAKQQKCCAGTDFRHRRVFPSKKTHGGSKGCAPATKAESAEQDITAIVKISLLNDQYKYDDVEYEDEDGDVDETVVRKCKEWLKGVENAAALGKVDKLSALPHLKGCWHLALMSCC